MKHTLMKHAVWAVLTFWLGMSISSAIASSYGMIMLQNSSKATYMCDSGQLTLAANCTDFWQLYGSSSKTMKVQKIFVCSNSIDNQVSTLFNTVLLIKRSTANSGGTSATPTIIPLDSNNASATAVVKTYSANPTLGTAVGTLWTLFRFSYNNNAPADCSACIFDAEQFGQPIVLRGTSEGICLNNNSTSQVGNIPRTNVQVIWTEEHPFIVWLILVSLAGINARCQREIAIFRNLRSRWTVKF